MPGEGMVGRTDALGPLREAVLRADQGAVTAAFVTGEAGIGKTSLLRAALASCTDGALLAWGTCWPDEGGPGFWPWSQALGGLVGEIGMDEAARLAGGDRDRIAGLVRQLRSDRTPGDAADDRVLLLDAVTRWLSAVAADRLVVVVLDDLQWADASTVDLLTYVLAAPGRARLVVLGAFRDTRDNTSRAGRLARLGDHATVVRLRGLGVEHVAELAARVRGASVAAEEARVLHARTGGHPLFVKELSSWGAGPPGAPLPPAVTTAVGRRLDAVPHDVLRVLRAASVLGNRVLPDVLAAATGDSPEAVTGHLGLAADSGLVTPLQEGVCWFVHDLYRETLYERLSGPDRARLHGQVGQGLELGLTRGAEVAPEDIARHLTLAIPHLGASPALEWADRAALSERRRSAFGEAAGHLRRVRESAAAAGLDLDQDVLVRLLIDEADDQARSGEPGAARDVLARARLVTDDPRLLTDVALAVQRLGGKFAAPRSEVLSQLETARTAVADVDLTRQAQVTAALARELRHSVAEDRARAAPLSAEALELGRASGDDATLMACLLARHDVLWTPGTGPARVTVGREIAAIATRLGDADHLAEALVLEANAHLESGSAAFRPVLDRWFGMAAIRDQPRDRYLVATRRAALALLEGDADGGEALMNEAADLGEQIQEPDTGNVLMSQRVALAGLRHEPVELRVLARDAVAWWTGAPLLAHAVAAGAYARAGDLELAATEVATVCESGGWAAEDSYLGAVLVSHLAEAAVALDDRALCRRLLDHVLPLSGACGVNGAVVAFAGPFAHTAGTLAAALGDRTAAERLLRRSIEITRRLGAQAWTRSAETALDALRAVPGRDGGVEAALLHRGPVWELWWHDERAVVPHRKGLTDLATLVQQHGREVPALVLAGSGTAGASNAETLIDARALRAYHDRLEEISGDLAEAEQAGDRGRHESLADEREMVLAEVRRATGLGGRLRTNAATPTERARKAVSARLRDAIASIDAVLPSMAAHLDRSVRTGLRCLYEPPVDDAVRWRVET